MPTITARQRRISAYHFRGRRPLLLLPEHGRTAPIACQRRASVRCASVWRSRIFQSRATRTPSTRRERSQSGQLGLRLSRTAAVRRQQHQRRLRTLTDQRAVSRPQRTPMMSMSRHRRLTCVCSSRSSTRWLARLRRRTGANATAQLRISGIQWNRFHLPFHLVRWSAVPSLAWLLVTWMWLLQIAVGRDGLALCRTWMIY